MSKNYYAVTKDTKVLFGEWKHARVEIGFENQSFNVHICQTTFGNLKPLFEKQTDCFENFKELKAFLINYRHQVSIIDEYGLIYEYDEFLNLMEKDSKEGISRMSKFTEMNSDSRCYKDEDNYEWMDSSFD